MPNRDQLLQQAHVALWQHELLLGYLLDFDIFLFTLQAPQVEAFLEATSSGAGNLCCA